MSELAPVWRPLRLIAAWAVLAWGFFLLGSVGWPEWLAGLFIASAAFSLGVCHRPKSAGGTREGATE